MPKRIGIAFHYYTSSIRNIFFWLIYSDETANFTYDITDFNKIYLAHFISLVSNVKADKIKMYLQELETNNDLQTYLNGKITSCQESISAAETMQYGRRLGWYALIRAIKPKVVVETGVDKGLGSCVITSALMQNAKEGFKGFYYGTDILPTAGVFFDYPYKKFGKILYGDSTESLKKLRVKIDIFINDSDHSPDYERGEYSVVKNKLNPQSIIISDNAHVTDELCKFADETGRKFLFFKETPKNHWYPGAGMGLAFRYK